MNVAHDTEGRVVFSDQYTDEEWDNLKNNYRIGDLIMPCCKSPAIPKTSSNFMKYFAHYSDECGNSPESIWHLESKELLVEELKKFGIDAILERTGEGQSGTWKADIYFEYNNLKYAFEIQHSYQKISEYFKRQKRYTESGVNCYWILYGPVYLTVTRSIGKYLIKNEFGGKTPKPFYGCSRELPLVVLDINNENNKIRLAKLATLSIKDYIRGVINNKFIFDEIERVWRVSTNI